MTIEPFDLTGRIALVTGAVGGLGAEIARGLARAGATIAVHHLDQKTEADRLVAELNDLGVNAASVHADVTDWDQAAEMVDTVTRTLGGIDILVNNAGYMKAGRIVEMSLADWQRTIDVDLTGVFITSRHALPGMLDRGHGAIINMTSQLAYKGAEDFASYCAAKAGVVGLTKAMSREVGPTVRVNAIAPGPITTPMTVASFDDALTQERTAGLVARRMGDAREIAPAVVYLASDAASFMHGQTLHLNGGGVMP